MRVSQVLILPSQGQSPDQIAMRWSWQGHWVRPHICSKLKNIAAQLVPILHPHLAHLRLLQLIGEFPRSTWNRVVILSLTWTMPYLGLPVATLAFQLFLIRAGKQIYLEDYISGLSSPQSSGLSCCNLYFLTQKVQTATRISIGQ